MDSMDWFHMDSMDWSTWNLWTGPQGLTQNRTEYLLIILVSKCRVIDKIMYFVQQAGSCHVTCSHVNQYEEHQSHHHHHHHHQSIPRRPLTAHHVYDPSCKSRHETTHPGQLQDATTMPSHAPDSQRNNANQKGSKTRGTRGDTERTGKTEGKREGKTKRQTAGRTRCARHFLYSIYLYSLNLPYPQLPLHQNMKNMRCIACFSCSKASVPHPSA